MYFSSLSNSADSVITVAFNIVRGLRTMDPRTSLRDHNAPTLDSALDYTIMMELFSTRKKIGRRCLVFKPPHLKHVADMGSELAPWKAGSGLL